MKPLKITSVKINLFLQNFKHTRFLHSEKSKTILKINILEIFTKKCVTFGKKQDHFKNNFFEIFTKNVQAYLVLKTL